MASEVSVPDPRGRRRRLVPELPRQGWRALLELGPFQWNAVHPRRALRVSVGVLVPFALGLATGRVEDGVFAALGAFLAGFVSFQGMNRNRFAAVVVASVGMALSTFVGAAAAAAVPWLLVPIVVVWAYTSGLGISLGPRMGVATLQWSVALLLAAELPMHPGLAALRSVLALAGGLFQAVLVAASWFLSPGERERDALADSFRWLAAFASDVSAERYALPPPITLPAVAALDDPNPLVAEPTQLALVDLLEVLERVRASLAALADQAARVPADAAGVRALAAQTAALLGLWANSLAGVRGAAATARAMPSGTAALRVPPDAAWRWAGEALLGQLREAERIVGRLGHAAAEPDRRDAEPDRIRQSGDPPLGLWATLRAHLGTRTEVGRHAVRLAVAAGIAESVALATGIAHGPWVALTLFFVLRPDYRSTMVRGVQRAVGTAVGAAVGAAIALLGHGGAVLAVATAVAVAAANAFFEVNLALFAVVLTTFLVVLFGLLGTPALPTAESRVVATFLGALIGMAAYVAWPTWEAVSAPETFGRMLDAHGAYMRALLEAVSAPTPASLARLRALQIAARSARSDAEASAARMTDEPSWPPFTAQAARSLLATVRRLAHAEVALHAFVGLRLPTGPGAPEAPRELLEALASALDRSMAALAQAARGLRAPVATPALRPLQVALASEPGVTGTVVDTATDSLVDAVNTLRQTLSDCLSKASA
jgi:hypothetical protein